jgi:CheY-like chemotaxis protein
MKSLFVSVALAGFDAADLACLTGTFSSLECPLGPASNWKILPGITTPSFQKDLEQNRVAMALCDQDRQPGAWKQLLDRFATLSRPPLLIVTSRLADDRLWAEALNLGAWDVLAKPFAVEEVSRIATIACIHWHRRPMASPPTTLLHSAA